MNWSPESIVPMMNPNEFLVDLMLAQFDPDKEEWEDIQMLVTGVENTGSRQVDIPLVFTNNRLLSDIRPIAVQVQLGEERSNTRRKRQIGRAIRRWSTVLYYSFSNTLRTNCKEWCDSQPDNIGRTILDELEMESRSCPPLLSQARLLSSGLVEDSGINRLLSNRFFHRGTDTCFRTREPR